MLKQVLKFAAKQVFLSPQERILVTGAELTAKGVKKVYNARQEAKKQKELEEKINNYSSRGFFKTLIMYLSGFISSFFIMKWGWFGIIIVLLGYLGHYQNLKEIAAYISVGREKTLTIICLIGLVCTFFLL